MSKSNKRQKTSSSSSSSNNKHDKSHGTVNQKKGKQKLSKIEIQLTNSDEENDILMLNDNQEEDTLVKDKLDTTLVLVKGMAKEIQTLVHQVNQLQDEIKDIKSVILTSKPNPNVNTASSHPPPKRNTHGPFPEYSSIDRSITRPSSKEVAQNIGGKVHSLQFTSSLYVHLIEKALGPSSKNGLDYKAMVKEAILITKAVISSIKEEYNLSPDLRWSYVDPTIKLAAYQKLENATEHLLPLKTCSEFWGAHVLISNFWLKRKKSKNTKSKGQKPPLPLPPPREGEEEEEDDDETESDENIPEGSKKRKLNQYSITFLTNQQSEGEKHKNNNNNNNS